MKSNQKTILIELLKSISFWIFISTITLLMVTFIDAIQFTDRYQMSYIDPTFFDKIGTNTFLLLLLDIPLSISNSFPIGIFIGTMISLIKLINRRVLISRVELLKPILILSMLFLSITYTFNLFFIHDVSFQFNGVKNALEYNHLSNYRIREEKYNTKGVSEHSLLEMVEKIKIIEGGDWYNHTWYTDQENINALKIMFIYRIINPILQPLLLLLALELALIFSVFGKNSKYLLSVLTIGVLISMHFLIKKGYMLAFEEVIPISLGMLLPSLTLLLIILSLYKRSNEVLVNIISSRGSVK